ncbi:MAG: glycosyltransferase family 2 protein [Gemmatimonadaceae bacterium]|nr:glycosyltransferase family 2 protein [Gemmatimonadaceae bacterium]
MTPAAACVIPAYEAAATVGAVIDGVRRAAPSVLIVVVDDGSRDDTSRAAAHADVVERLAVNGGKGAALRAGFAAALDRGVERVVTLDADGQHDASLVPAFLAALDTHDLVLGVRARRGSAMPLVRRIANGISTRLIGWCARRPIRDAQCGFRGMRAALLRAVPHVGDRYEAETAFVIRAARAGARIGEVRVPTRYGPPSHFRPLPDAARIVATIWALRPSRLLPCDSSAPTTTASSPTASTAWSAPRSRSVR